MRRVSLLVGLTGIIITISVAGCGGASHGRGETVTAVSGAGSRSAVEAAGSVSASSSISTADAICKRTDAELGTVALGRGEIEVVAGRRAALERNELSELRRVAVPASLKHDYGIILADKTSLIADTVNLGKAMALKHRQAIASLFKSSVAVQNEMKNVGQRRGFKYCQEVG